MRSPRQVQIVDPDRISNPHGEHALEAFRLLEPVDLGGGAAVPGAATQAAGAAAAQGGS